MMPATPAEPRPLTPQQQAAAEVALLDRMMRLVVREAAP
jgi:hypothetical protein